VCLCVDRRAVVDEGGEGIETQEKGGDKGRRQIGGWRGW
jgi:hypothetical protein